MPAAEKTRALTIADCQNRLGRASVMLLNGAHWHEPVTENPRLNSTMMRPYEILPA